MDGYSKTEVRNNGVPVTEANTFRLGIIHAGGPMQHEKGIFSM